MGRLRTALYDLGLASLFTHEMDAVMRSEWRLLYFLRDMADDRAYPVFLALHVPLFAAILWLSHHRNTRVRDAFRIGMAAFLVVHGVLHLRLSGSPENAFEGILSNGLILAAAVLGLAYLASVLRERRGRGAPS